jgi:AraC family transcriptional regulator
MKPDTRSFYVRAVHAAIEHIASHLDDALELAVLARLACPSPFHFHRLFRGMVGETPLELARRLRLERAAWRLGDKKRAITEIVFDAGYETHEAFTRAFRAAYSTSPSGFRLRTYPRVEIAAACGVHVNDDGVTRGTVREGTEND